MRKIITVAALSLLVGSAFASDSAGPQHKKHHHHHSHAQQHKHNEWVVPMIGGLVIGTIIANSQGQPVYVPSQPIPSPVPGPVILPPPANPYPPIVYEHSPPQPVYRRYEQYDPSCQCVRVWDVRVR